MAHRLHKILRRHNFLAQHLSSPFESNRTVRCISGQASTGTGFKSQANDHSSSESKTTKKISFAELRQKLKYPTVNERRNIKPNLDAKLEEVEEKIERYPFLKMLHITTDKDGRHSLSADTKHVQKMIGLGLIPHFLGSQFCHYLCDLCRSEPDVEQRETLAQQAFATLKQVWNKSEAMDKKLCIDMSDTTPVIGKKVVDLIKTKSDDWLSHGAARSILQNLIGLGLWDQCNVAMRRLTPVCTIRLDKMTKGLQTTASILDASVANESSQAKIRSDLYNLLVDLCDMSRSKRVQFSSDNVAQLEQAFNKIGFTTRQTEISQDGVCSTCQSQLPHFDDKLLKAINRQFEEDLLGFFGKHRKEIYGPKIDHLEFTKAEDFDYIERLSELAERHIKRTGEFWNCVIDIANVLHNTPRGRTFKNISRDPNQVIGKKYIVADFYDPEHYNLLAKEIMPRYKAILVVSKKSASYRRFLDLREKMSADMRRKLTEFTTRREGDDDLFMLWVSTRSAHTDLITNDQFIDRLRLYDDEMRAKVLRWMDTHITRIVRHDSRYKMLHATPYEKCASLNEQTGHVHIPMMERAEGVPYSIHGVAPEYRDTNYKWLCCHARR